MAENKDLTFNTTSGQTIARELLIAYLNTGTNGNGNNPTWSAFGKRVEESDVELDWSTESVQDILGNTWTTMKKPVITQSFDPIPLDAGDPAAVKLWNLGVKDHDAQSLANQDMLIAHFYVNSNGDSDTNKNWAERYSGCAIAVTRIGGEGGGNLEISTDITYGGERTLGTVSKTDNAVTFTADTAAAASENTASQEAK